MSLLEDVVLDGSSGMNSHLCGFAIIVLSFSLFHIFSQAVKSVQSRSSLSTHDQWDWRGFFVSWAHSGLISIWNITCFYLYWHDVTADLVTYRNLNIYCMVAFTTGYFLYDFTDIWINAGPVKQWEVLLHHCGVIGIFLYNLATCKCLGYSMVALIVEFNTFFLHSRKLLQKHPVPYDHWLYRLTVWANLITFVLCRFLPLGLLCHGIYTLNVSQLVSVAYLVVLSLSIIIMLAIYPILFYRIVKNDIIRYHRSRRNKKSTQNGTKTNNNSIDKRDKGSFLMPDNSQANGLVNRLQGAS